VDLMHFNVALTTERRLLPQSYLFTSNKLSSA